jgi:nicotinate-nucleotide--dimethylbenzimidazole phosphoribosyltransferase
MQLERSLIAQIVPPLNESAIAVARARHDSLTKPPGSLGRLEDLAVKLAGIFGDPRPRIKHKAIITVGGNHAPTQQQPTGCLSHPPASRQR